MNINIPYFESLLLVIAILVVLFIANIRYWRPIIINRLSLIYIFTATSAAFYLGRVLVENNASLVILNKIFVVASSIFLMLACLFYYYYVLKQTGREFKNAKFWYISSFVLIAAVTIIFGISFFAKENNMAFYVDDSGVYHSGPLFFVLLIACYSYILCGIIFSALKGFQSELLSEKHKYATIAWAIAPSIVLAIINNFFPYPNGLPLLFFGIAISLLILFASSSAGRVTRDGLTGLLNRFAFDALLTQAMKKTAKTTQKSLFLLIIDINGFKGINDTFGHAVGDEVLVKFSNTVQNVCEKYDATLGRWGGDEFVIFVESEDAKAFELVSTLKQAVRDNCNDDSRFVVSISIGAAKLREYETMKHFFEEADHKLYEDKRKFHQEETKSSLEAKM